MINNGRLIFKQISLFVLTIFISLIIGNELLLSKETQAAQLGLPEPTELLSRTNDYVAPVLKGMRLDPQNPLNISFIVDMGSANTLEVSQRERLVSYFLAALTVSKENIWVNLSPYESDRVIPEVLASTDLGKDLLAQDYILKQLSASLTHPQTPLGTKYWDLANAMKAGDDNLSKIWITPDSADIYTYKSAVVIKNASLKLQTAKDYIAFAENKQNNLYDNAAKTLLPQLEQELNNGKHFSQLRQIYHSLILAEWFKKAFANSFYEHYINQNKVNGIELRDKSVKDKIYKLYCEAFKKGVYSIVQKVKRGDKAERTKYFSGGFEAYDLELNDTELSSPIEMSDSFSQRVMEIDVQLSSSSLTAVEQRTKQNELIRAYYKTGKDFVDDGVLRKIGDSWAVHLAQYKVELDNGGLERVDMVITLPQEGRTKSDKNEIFIKAKPAKSNKSILLDFYNKQGNLLYSDYEYIFKTSKDLKAMNDKKAPRIKQENKLRDYMENYAVINDSGSSRMVTRLGQVKGFAYDVKLPDGTKDRIDLRFTMSKEKRNLIIGKQVWVVFKEAKDNKSVLIDVYDKENGNLIEANIEYEFKQAETLVEEKRVRAENKIQKTKLDDYYKNAKKFTDYGAYKKYQSNGNIRCGIYDVDLGEGKTHKQTLNITVPESARGKIKSDDVWVKFTPASDNTKIYVSIYTGRDGELVVENLLYVFRTEEDYYARQRVVTGKKSKAQEQELKRKNAIKVAKDLAAKRLPQDQRTSQKELIADYLNHGGNFEDKGASWSVDGRGLLNSVRYYVPKGDGTVQEKQVIFAIPAELQKKYKNSELWVKFRPSKQKGTVLIDVYESENGQLLIDNYLYKFSTEQEVLESIEGIEQHNKMMTYRKDGETFVDKGAKKTITSVGNIRMRSYQVLKPDGEYIIEPFLVTIPKASIPSNSKRDVWVQVKAGENRETVLFDIYDSEGGKLLVSDIVYRFHTYEEIQKRNDNLAYSQEQKKKVMKYLEDGAEFIDEGSSWPAVNNARRAWAYEITSLDGRAHRETVAFGLPKAIENMAKNGRVWLVMKPSDKESCILIDVYDSKGGELLNSNYEYRFLTKEDLVERKRTYNLRKQQSTKINNYLNLGNWFSDSGATWAAAKDGKISTVSYQTTKANGKQHKRQVSFRVSINKRELIHGNTVWVRYRPSVKNDKILIDVYDKEDGEIIEEGIEYTFKTSDVFNVVDVVEPNVDVNELIHGAFPFGVNSYHDIDQLLMNKSLSVADKKKVMQMKKGDVFEVYQSLVQALRRPGNKKQYLKFKVNGDDPNKDIGFINYAYEENGLNYIESALGNSPDYIKDQLTDRLKNKHISAEKIEYAYLYVNKSSQKAFEEADILAFSVNDYAEEIEDSSVRAILNDIAVLLEKNNFDFSDLARTSQLTRFIEHVFYHYVENEWQTKEEASDFMLLSLESIKYYLGLLAKLADDKKLFNDQLTLEQELTFDSQIAGDYQYLLDIYDRDFIPAYDLKKGRYVRKMDILRAMPRDAKEDKASPQKKSRATKAEKAKQKLNKNKIINAVKEEAARIDRMIELGEAYEDIKIRQHIARAKFIQSLLEHDLDVKKNEIAEILSSLPIYYWEYDDDVDLSQADKVLFAGYQEFKKTLPGLFSLAGGVVGINAVYEIGRSEIADYLRGEIKKDFMEELLTEEPDVGGVDFADINLNSSSSLTIEIPDDFNIDNFKGFSFSVISSSDVTTADRLLANWL